MPHGGLASMASACREPAAFAARSACPARLRMAAHGCNRMHGMHRMQQEGVMGPRGVLGSRLARGQLH